MEKVKLYVLQTIPALVAEGCQNDTSGPVPPKAQIQKHVFEGLGCLQSTLHHLKVDGTFQLDKKLLCRAVVSRGERAAPGDAHGMVVVVMMRWGPKWLTSWS